MKSVKIILVGNTPLAFFLAQKLVKNQNLIISVLKTEENNIDFGSLPVSLTQTYSNLFINDWVVLCLRPKRLEVECFFYNVKGFETKEFFEDKVPVKRFKPGLLSLVPGLLMEDIKSSSLFSKNVLTGFVRHTLHEHIDLFVSGADDEISYLKHTVLSSSDTLTKIKNKHVWRDFVLTEFVVYFSMFFFRNQTIQTMTKIRDWCNVEKSKKDVQTMTEYFKDFALLKSFIKNFSEAAKHKSRYFLSGNVHIVHDAFEVWMQEKHKDQVSFLSDQYSFIEIGDFKDPYQIESLINRQLVTRPRLTDLLHGGIPIDVPGNPIQNGSTGSSPKSKNCYSFVKVPGFEFPS